MDEKENDMYKVSLILTTYNCVNNLSKTFSSILSQDYNNIEVIVVDGASTDGTIDLIREFEDKINLKWISENDRGIYDAMNKGYRMSTGDIVAFFNDQFVKEDVVTKMVDAIVKNDADGAHADLVYMSEELKVIRHWKMGDGTIRQGWMPGHPTLFLKREVYEKYGTYNDDYKCSADYEFMVRILKDSAVKLAYVPEVVVQMFYGGTSTGGIKGYILSLKEAHRALSENGVKGALIIDIKRILRLVQQFIRA